MFGAIIKFESKFVSKLTSIKKWQQEKADY